MKQQRRAAPPGPIEVERTTAFREWLTSLQDDTARYLIIMRLERFSDGNFGESDPVGEGVSESALDYGPGYRIYFATEGPPSGPGRPITTRKVIVLYAGDKSTQVKDIKLAKTINAERKTSAKATKKAQRKGKSK